MPLVNGTGNKDKSSGGSVDTTKTLSDPQRVGMYDGERGQEAPPKASKPTPWPRANPPPFRRAILNVREYLVFHCADTGLHNE